MDKKEILPVKLPPFRKDLKIYPGPFDPDGSPTYNIHDPVKGFFSKISWKEYVLIKNFQGNVTAEELADKISRNFPFKITPQDVKDFFSQAFVLGYLSIPIEGNTAAELQRKSKQTWFQFFYQNLFFLKVPLFHPDAFLTRTLPYVKFLGSKPALIIYAFIVFIGAFLLLNRFEAFFNTLTYIFNFQNLIMFGLTISFVKCVHELSHAYVAKANGLYVPTMGVGLLFFWPVLYTDVTESWKLMQRKQRLYISIAGIASELVLAGLATIGWIMSLSGLSKSLFFLLASTTWFSSLLINSNPFVRWDGYYVLSDLWGIDNLQQYAFGYTRWWVHRHVFGVDEPPPDEKISRRRAIGLMLYSLGIITYRIVIYTTIVLIVYHGFTKILGIFLFLSEVLVLFILPVQYEIKQLYQKRAKMKMKAGSVLSILLLTLLAVWFFIPLPHEIRLNGVIAAKDRQVIYSPENGKIEKILIKMGDKVTPEMPLVQVDSIDLDEEISKYSHDQDALRNEILFLSSNHESESLISKKQAELDQNEQLLLGLKKRKEKLDLKAEVAGDIVNWDPTLKIGQFVHEKQVLGSIADPKYTEVIAFAQEIDVENIKIGQPARIFFQSSNLEILDAKITQIDRKRVNELIYPSLASIYGGELAVVHQKSQGNLFLHDSYFQITLAFEEPPKNVIIGTNVVVKTRGPWRSYFYETLKYIIRTITKESSF